MSYMCRPILAVASPMASQEAETTARTFYESWICRFGSILRIATDQGPRFESHLFQALNRLTGTKYQHSTSFHPHANGSVKRFHTTKSSHPLLPKRFVDQSITNSAPGHTSSLARGSVRNFSRALVRTTPFTWRTFYGKHQQPNGSNLFRPKTS